MNTPLVSVKTITYNHAPFIRKCIEGVIMQRTNFPFEYIIGDDCSTDGTAEIVKEYAQKYPKLIRLVSSEKNVGAFENDHRTDAACRGKYVAFCEGDDFWTHPDKLQKQVDFLESHPEYGMIHSDFSNLVGTTLVRNVWKNRTIPEGEVFEALVLENFVVTATVCIRSELLQKIRLENVVKSRNWSMGDYPRWLEVAGEHKVGYIPEDMATYRVHPHSISHNLDWPGKYSFFKDRYDIKKYYARKYHADHLLQDLEDMYHKELLKFSIFLKSSSLRKQCVKHYTTYEKNGFFVWRLFAKHSVLDPLFALLYFLKQKFKLRESL